jgi:hypothetical protein
MSTDAFAKWFASLTPEQRYDFDSEGRGYKKDATHMMRLAYTAAKKEVERDTARLDWLGKQWADGVHVEVYAKTIRPECYEPTATVFIGKNGYRGASLRDAIDAAIFAQAQAVADAARQSYYESGGLHPCYD